MMKFDYCLQFYLGNPGYPTRCLISYCSCINGSTMTRDTFVGSY